MSHPVDLLPEMTLTDSFTFSESRRIDSHSQIEVFANYDPVSGAGKCTFKVQYHNEAPGTKDSDATWKDMVQADETGVSGTYDFSAVLYEIAEAGVENATRDPHASFGFSPKTIRLAAKTAVSNSSKITFHIAHQPI